MLSPIHKTNLLSTTRPIYPGDIFKHYKGPHYKVINVSKHTETNEQLVIYHDISKPDIFWARPLEMFNSYITWNDTFQLRFAPILNTIIPDIPELVCSTNNTDNIQNEITPELK